MIKIYLALAAMFAALAVGLVVGSTVTDAHWQKKWNAHVAADAAVVKAAEDHVAAAEKVQAARDTTAAVTQAQVQERIVYRTTTIIKRIPDHVTPAQDASGCVTYGLVRVLDAAALGADPGDLELPAGKSDDACAPVKASALAASIVENYGVGQQNAEQLNALIADTRARTDLFNSTKEIPQ